MCSFFTSHQTPVSALFLEHLKAGIGQISVQQIDSHHRVVEGKCQTSEASLVPSGLEQITYRNTAADLFVGSVWEAFVSQLFDDRCCS